MQHSEAEARFTAWATASGASQDDVEACLAQLIDFEKEAELPPESDEDQDDIDRRIDRIRALARDIEHASEDAIPTEAQRREDEAQAATRMWTLVSQWIEIDVAYRALREMEDAEGLEWEVYGEVAHGVMGAAVNLWNEHDQRPLAFALFAWCAMEAFRARDPEGLATALHNMSSGSLTLV